MNHPTAARPDQVSPDCSAPTLNLAALLAQFMRGFGGPLVAEHVCNPPEQDHWQPISSEGVERLVGSQKLYVCPECEQPYAVRSR